MKKQTVKEYHTPILCIYCLHGQVLICASKWGATNEAGNDINSTSGEGDIFNF